VGDFVGGAEGVGRELMLGRAVSLHVASWKEKKKLPFILRVQVSLNLQLLDGDSKKRSNEIVYQETEQSLICMSPHRGRLDAYGDSSLFDRGARRGRESKLKIEDIHLIRKRWISFMLEQALSPKNWDARGRLLHQGGDGIGGESTSLKKLLTLHTRGTILRVWEKSAGLEELRGEQSSTAEGISLWGKKRKRLFKGFWPGR